MSKRRIIRIAGNSFYLTPSDFFPLEKTNLPSGKLSFRLHSEIFWEIEIATFDPVDKNLKVRVVDYYPKETSGFKNQQIKKEIHRLEFEPLKWGALEPFLSHYQKMALKDVVIESEKIYRPEIIREFKIPVFPLPEPFPIYDPSPETITEEFEFYFKDMEVGNGHITFQRLSPIIQRKLTYKILNDFLKAEFNYIKNYFAKSFNRKKFEVTATITYTGHAINTITASSPQISAINSELIDSIRTDSIMRLLSTPISPVENTSLFDADTIFSNFEQEEDLRNLFPRTDKDILTTILAYKKVRNETQLQYLAGAKQAKHYQIKYTLKPLFGFLFFIEGATKNHFCWELLNSHATYLWSFAKENNLVSSQYARMDNIIKNLKILGRGNYKDAYKSGKIDVDLGFCTINHSQEKSDEANGFYAWKVKLSSLLV
ncbi:hypothetical protein [Adhaeribacter rhizoryzae]|uniref:Uncharacterized protein n=1 Tax=Adhaeribacter rhizoryzae TaxID=2607907 RepID=A0A5M6D3C1_9BACT|nr:hypothetical protein [Adhaeribacter rhizoryzae]KAA5541974.1 hypothetical protein F0145_19500 [Adhaeribacter rhizoryzae]